MEVRPGYKQTEVGVIPKDWVVRTIESVCTLINGRGFKPFEWKLVGLPIIRIQNLNGSDEFNYFDGSHDRKLEVSPGQLLFAWSGSRGTSFGPHLWSGPLGLLNYHTWKVQVRDTEIEPIFFFHALRKLTEFIEGRAHGASALVHTQKWEMEGFVFASPSDNAEQRAIAAALGDADALLAALDRLIAKKRDLKQAAMQKLLTGQRRLPGFDGEWELTRIVSLITTGPKNGYSGRSARNARGTPTLSLGATTSGALTLNDETVKRLEETIDATSDLYLQRGDVLVQRSNTIDLVGTTAVFDGPSGVYVYPDLMMRMRFREEATAHWFWRYANSANGRRFFINVAAGSSGSMPKISGAKLRQMRLPLPSLPEQRAIAAVLSDMDAEIEALEKRRDKTRALKQGMMQELLTGRTRLV